jgi:hypothetical protein
MVHAASKNGAVIVPLKVDVALCNINTIFNRNTISFAIVIWTEVADFPAVAITAGNDLHCAAADFEINIAVDAVWIHAGCGFGVTATAIAVIVDGHFDIVDR